MVESAVTTGSGKTDAVPEHVDLRSLSPGHAVRARPMRESRIECRNRHAGGWRDVGKWAIGMVPFDGLGACWLDNNDFRAPSAVVDACATDKQA